MKTIVLSLRYLLVQITALLEANNYKSLVLVALVMPKKFLKKRKERRRNIHLEGWQVSTAQKDKQCEKFTFIMFTINWQCHPLFLKHKDVKSSFCSCPPKAWNETQYLLLISLDTLILPCFTSISELFLPLYPQQREIPTGIICCENAGAFV